MKHGSSGALPPRSLEVLAVARSLQWLSAFVAADGCERITMYGQHYSHPNIDVP
jgi:hypothetical protein